MKNLILGTGVSFSKEPEVAENVISAALDNGVRRFDTAPSYKTEGLLGDILSKECKRRKLLRNELYIQSKIDAWQMQDGRIDLFVEDALEKLKVDYLDALLIHWPIPEYMRGTWKKMEEARERGTIRRIGICNVRMRQIKEYIPWKPDIIQIERHPLNTFEEEVEFCQLSGIEVQAYSPLCKMDDRIKNSKKIRAMEKKYGKDEGQVVLRWHLDTGVIPIFTTTKIRRIESYTSLDDFSLTKSEIEEISSLNENYKMYLESVACPGF